MKTLLYFLPLIFLASCADKVQPRAIELIELSSK
jgi:hypothetical protein